VLDPRIAGLMTAMMEGVIQYGTGAGVRARGFTAPAAGKTGTSHDGWFAGYTSNLLCVVWVGFDDNEELPLEGARSALPIWAEFMKRASALRQYRDMVPFDEPAGVATVDIDPASGQLATPYCPEHRLATFIEGSQPTEVCVLHTLPQIARPRAVLTAPPPALPPAPLPAPSREAAPASSHVAQSPPGAIPGDSARPPAAPASQQPQAQADKKKRNLFSRIWGAVAGSSDSKTQRTKRQ
jgi:penicillin-binding protein 1B